MKVRVIAFASAGDVVGKAPLEIELADDAGTEALGIALIEKFPALEAMWPRLAVAVEGVISKGDTLLGDGAEVALLPPVSGGAPVATVEVGVARKTQLVTEPIDVAAVEHAVRNDACGAVVLFLGTVRDHHGGKRVARLVYSAYESLAADRLEQIAIDLESAHDGLHVAIVHRIGDVPLGAPSVVIAVASSHRQAAYDVSRLALERLKREVPIWKRETYDDGREVWREEEPLG